ncbi:MAG TPA: magnesium transporter [Blastocatellia bacterium]|nr:magnesium transporter [Blastocatellia bacterium]
METRSKVLKHSAIPVPLARKLLHRGARQNLARIFAKAYPVDVARLLSILGGAERGQAFSVLLDECEQSHAAAVLSEMEADDSLALLERIEPKRIAQLLGELPADDATFLASRLPDPLAAQVLTLMEAQPAAGVRELLEHDERTAGRMMTTNYFALEEDVTVSEAITALQRRSEEIEMVFYVYVIDKRDHLVGVVSLRKLLTTPPSTQLKRMMVPEVISARTSAPQEEVARLVAEYNLLAVPITDDEDRLSGIVTVDDIIDVVQDEAAEDLLALAGVAAEERVNTTAARSLRLRAPWLLVNLPTAFLASFVVSQFDSSIRHYPSLAAMMPIVAGMGGNAGTQALTVVIRGLAMGELFSLSRTTLKATLVGLGNGIINGLVGAVIVALFFRDTWLGIVLAMAMIINMIVAGVAGTLIPVVLKKVHVDPAAASSVFVTTCTDVAGFFSFLGIATLLMSLLNVK